MKREETNNFYFYVTKHCFFFLLQLCWHLKCPGYFAANFPITFFVFDSIGAWGML